MNINTSSNVVAMAFTRVVPNRAASGQEKIVMNARERSHLRGCESIDFGGRGTADESAPTPEASNPRPIERLRRRADHLPARGRDAHHREPALVGAVGA